VFDFLRLRVNGFCRLLRDFGLAGWFSLVWILGNRSIGLSVDNRSVVQCLLNGWDLQ
jgi:hypothetical protein